MESPAAALAVQHTAPALQGARQPVRIVLTAAAALAAATMRVSYRVAPSAQLAAVAGAAPDALSEAVSAANAATQNVDVEPSDLKLYSDATSADALIDW